MRSACCASARAITSSARSRSRLRLNVRTFKDQVRNRVLSAIKRILDAEAAASGAPKPPETSVLSQ